MILYRWSTNVKRYGRAHIVGLDGKTLCQIENCSDHPGFTDLGIEAPDGLYVCGNCEKLQTGQQIESWKADKAVQADPDTHPEPDYEAEIPSWVTEEIPIVAYDG